MKGKKPVLIAVSCLLILALAAAAGWYFFVVDNIADEVIIEAGSVPLAGDYLIRDLGIPVEFETDLSEINLTVPGVYDVTLSYRGRSYPARLRVRDSRPPEAALRELTVFATQRPEPEAFFLEIQDATEVTVAYAKEPDMTIDGPQTVRLLLTDRGGNETLLEATLTVIQDNTPPEIIGVQPIRHFVGHELDYLAGISVSDDLDPGVRLQVDDSQVNLNKAGEYILVYSAQDICGNRSEVSTPVTVIEDFEPPVILGAADRSLCVGSTISYRSGIILRDNLDPAPRLTIDSSGVDLSKPGTYPLVYHATDEAGNTATLEIQVTVHEKVYYYVDEETIWAEADRVLSWLVNDDMTDREKVEAVYWWIQRNHTYVSHADHLDWKQSAYQMRVTLKGDCYSFFALSKLMFERLGIPNIDVKRLRTPEHGADHYWSMVSVDGGQTWYHYDSTPFDVVPEEFCLVTDAYLDDFSARYRNYYNRDRDSLPATP